MTSIALSKTRSLLRILATCNLLQYSSRSERYIIHASVRACCRSLAQELGLTYESARSAATCSIPCCRLVCSPTQRSWMSVCAMRQQARTLANHFWPQSSDLWSHWCIVMGPNICRAGQRLNMNIKVPLKEQSSHDIFIVDS